MKFSILNSEVYYLTRGFIASTRAFNLPTRDFNLATRTFNLLTREFELVTRVLLFYSSVTRNRKENTNILKREHKHSVHAV